MRKCSPRTLSGHRKRHGLRFLHLRRVLGWNAKNLTLINCTIESLQGMCYIENLVMKNCKLLNTNLAFEYSTVDAEITSDIVSVLNPTSGIIRAASIGELIMDKEKIDPSKTEIVCEKIGKVSDHLMV